MKIIILGSNGMLGSYLTSYFESKFNVLPLTRNEYDLSKIDENDFINFFIKIIESNDIIINAAGVIKQREYDLLDMIMINSVLPHLLAKIKDIVKCEVIHITTDCVFSGSKGSYIESDKHDSIDDYGKSKSLGENNNLTIIRTSIIGEEKFNKKSLLEWVKSNKEKSINGYTSHQWNGITCLELAKFINSIIIDKYFWCGVRHIFSPSVVNKYELLEIINKVYDLNILIKPINEKPYIIRNLKTKYLNRYYITKPIEKQIEELKKYNDNN